MTTEIINIKMYKKKTISNLKITMMIWKTEKKICHDQLIGWTEQYADFCYEFTSNAICRLHT